MSHIQQALGSWVQAIESSFATLRIVSAELEAEFDRVYYEPHGASSTALNPQRLIARLSALELAAPAAADAVLALAQQELEAARMGRAAVGRASKEVALLEAIVPQVGGADSAIGDIDEGEEEEDARLKELLARLKVVANATARTHAMFVAADRAGAEQVMSEEDLDMELIKAGLSADALDHEEAGTVEREDNNNDGFVGDGKATTKGSSNEAKRPGAKPQKSRGKGPVQRKPGPGKSNGRGGEGKENAQSGGPGTGKKNSTRKPSGRPQDPGPVGFMPIGKPEYQRLPRMLKQQAKLDELNAVYERVHGILSGRTSPMGESELLSACGEESDKRIDVLRRGFSLLKRGKQGWTLGSAPPPQTVGRARPPLDPSSAAANAGEK